MSKDWPGAGVRGEFCHVCWPMVEGDWFGDDSSFTGCWEEGGRPDTGTLTGTLTGTEMELERGLGPGPGLEFVDVGWPGGGCGVGGAFDDVVGCCCCCCCCGCGCCCCCCEASMGLTFLRETRCFSSMLRRDWRVNGFGRTSFIPGMGLLVEIFKVRSIRDVPWWK